MDTDCTARGKRAREASSEEGQSLASSSTTAGALQDVHQHTDKRLRDGQVGGRGQMAGLTLRQVPQITDARPHASRPRIACSRHSAS